MAVPQVLEGRMVVIELGNGASPEVFTPICGMNVTSWNKTLQTTDRFLRDCANPTEIPSRKAIATGKQEDITLSGYFTLENRALMESIFGTRQNLRLTFYEEDGVTEAGYYSGRFLVTAQNIAAPDNDTVSLELVLASDGPLSAWTDVPRPVLATLSVSPLTATEGSQWVGTVSGKTPGSVITAASGDSTSLLVAENAGVVTVSGVFATTGSKVITLIETQQFASGSPKTTTVTVVVS